MISKKYLLEAARSQKLTLVLAGVVHQVDNHGELVAGLDVVTNRLEASTLGTGPLGHESGSSLVTGREHTLGVVGGHTDVGVGERGSASASCVTSAWATVEEDLSKSQ